MILIPAAIKLKLIELDIALHSLGRSLYGKKSFSDYQESNYFHNFKAEFYPDGSFSLHFLGNILGHMDTKYFQTTAGKDSNEIQLSELELVISTVNNRLKLVSA